MTISEAMAYIQGYQKSGKPVHDLSRIQALLDAIGNPQEQLQVIHIAGTNGKGSVTAFCAAAATAAGFRTGTLTSPFIQHYTDRIQIDGQDIPGEALCRFCEQVKACPVSADCSQFEITFAIALLWFLEQHCDLVVLETGIGGLLDATNVVKKPLVCAITSVSFDHMALLGNTLTEIAAQKAGIIKPGVPVIYFRRDEAAARVIEDTAKERGADIIPVEKSDYIINHLGNKTIDFSLHNRYYSYCNLQIQKTSLYQVENVSLAVTAFRMLMERRNVPEQDIEKTVRNALLQFYWEGRMEEIAPHIYVDGAHNVEAVNAYIETMNRLHGEYDKILVFAAVKDKEYDSMIHLLAGNITFGRIIVTSVDSSRKADSAKLAEIFSACTDTPVMVSDEIDDAMDMAVELRGDRENTNIYCVGSLYLVGGVKRWRNRHDQF